MRELFRKFIKKGGTKRKEKGVEERKRNGETKLYGRKKSRRVE